MTPGTAQQQQLYFVMTPKGCPMFSTNLELLARVCIALKIPEVPVPYNP